MDFLVGMGYRLDELSERSFRQIDALYQIALRRKAREHGELASVTRSAYHAELKSFKKLLASLED